MTQIKIDPEHYIATKTQIIEEICNIEIKSETFNEALNIFNKAKKIEKLRNMGYKKLVAVCIYLSYKQNNEPITKKDLAKAFPEIYLKNIGRYSKKVYHELDLDMNFTPVRISQFVNRYTKEIYPNTSHLFQEYINELAMEVEENLQGCGATSQNLAVAIIYYSAENYDNPSNKYSKKRKKAEFTKRFNIGRLSLRDNYDRVKEVIED